MNDYYPFGLTFNSYSRENSADQKYTYNGKEEQDELDLGWLDYGARMYMPEIGRWGVIDPLAENFYPASPYSYALNNPVNLTDPDGRSAEPVIDDKNKTITVNMRFVFYGKGATDDNMKAALATVNGMWNANADKDGWSDAGDGWKIKVVATGEITDEAGAEEIAGDNEGNALYNFIRIEDETGTWDPDTNEPISETSEHAGNSGIWATKDTKKGDTTPAHEVGHGFGLSTPWHDNAEGIMVAGTDNRKVTSGNVSALRSNILQNSTQKTGLIDKYVTGPIKEYFTGTRTVNYGSTNTVIYDANGNRKGKK